MSIHPGLVKWLDEGGKFTVPFAGLQRLAEMVADDMRAANYTLEHIELHDGLWALTQAWRHGKTVHSKSCNVTIQVRDQQIWASWRASQTIYWVVTHENLSATDWEIVE